MRYAARLMIYSFLSLRGVGAFVGVLLVVSHLLALRHPGSIQNWLKKFPRSWSIGVSLITIAGLWAFWLVATMDLGEFTSYRPLLMIIVPATWIVMMTSVREFLAVRAFGMLLLLAAEPLLEVAFLQHAAWRYLLVVLAYGWVIAGLFFIGMPFLLRDGIEMLRKTPMRWRLAAIAGIIYGAALILSSLILHHPF